MEARATHNDIAVSSVHSPRKVLDRLRPSLLACVAPPSAHTHLLSKGISTGSSEQDALPPVTKRVARPAPILRSMRSSLTNDPDLCRRSFLDGGSPRVADSRRIVACDQGGADVRAQYKLRPGAGGAVGS